MFASYKVLPVTRNVAFYAFWYLNRRELEISPCEICTSSNVRIADPPPIFRPWCQHLCVRITNSATVFSRCFIKTSHSTQYCSYPRGSNVFARCTATGIVLPHLLNVFLEGFNELRLHSLLTFLVVGSRHCFKICSRREKCSKHFVIH